jgi:hypothetical protein
MYGQMRALTGFKRKAKTKSRFHPIVQKPREPGTIEGRRKKEEGI